MIATGSDPVVPPVPGLRELDGVWTNREATGLTEVPRRLLILGGGPVGVELGQALARMGASVAIVEGAGHLLAREPRPLGDALADGAGGRRRRAAPRTAGRRGAAGDGEDFVLELADGTELRGDRLLVATGRRPRVADLGLETVGVEPGRGGIAVDARMSAGDGLWAIGDVDRRLAADLRRQVPGAGRRREHPRRAPRRPTTPPSRGSCSPTRRPRRSARPTAR